MTDTSLSPRTEEILRGGELAELHARVAPGSDLGSAATVRDVAEAAGLPEADVVAHLQQIRAESAFSEPRVGRPSPLPWIAGATLLVGLGVTWWRIHPDTTVPTTNWMPSVSGPVVRPFVTTQVPNRTQGEGIERPPLGFRVEAIGQRSVRSGDNYGDMKAMPYEYVRDGLAQSIEALIVTMASQDGSEPAPPGTTYQANDAGVVTPRPGFVRASVSGWTGHRAAWIAVPITKESKAAIAALAGDVVSGVKEAQDAALAPVADPRSGLVVPPPGFSVRFAGRRIDLRQGPRISFSGIARWAVVDRLTAALLNAAYRDRRPPMGSWSGDAKKDLAIPQPSSSRVEIMGPDGLDTADLPTVPGEEAATAAAARSLAERIAVQIDGVNRRALQTDRTP